MKGISRSTVRRRPSAMLKYPFCTVLGPEYLVPTTYIDKCGRCVKIILARRIRKVSVKLLDEFYRRVFRVIINVHTKEQNNIYSIAISSSSPYRASKIFTTGCS